MEETCLIYTIVAIMGGYQATLSGGSGESVAPAYGCRRSTLMQLVYPSTDVTLIAPEA